MAITRAQPEDESTSSHAMESRRSHERWLVLLFLSMMYFITYLDRVSLANTAPLISSEFRFSKATMGIIFSAFIWAYALFQVPGGWLGDRFGPRKVLTAIMAYRAMIAVLTARALGFYSLWTVRFMLGVGEAGAFPTATRAIQTWFPRQERGFAQGISHAASRFGAAIGPPLAVLIVIHYRWRMLFYVIAAITLIWAVLFPLIYRNTPEEHSRVSRGELAVIRGLDERGRIKPLHAKRRPKVPWKILLKHPNMWGLMCAYFTYLYCLWIFLSWLPSYLVSYRGFSLLQMGVYGAMPLGAGVFGDIFGGWFTDFLLVKTGNVKFARRFVAILGMLGCGGCIIPAAFTKNPAIAVWSLTGAMFFLETIIGPSWAVPMDIGGDYSGTVSGMMNMGGQIGGALSPTVFGILVSRGLWIAPFVIAACLLLIGAGIWAFWINPEVSVVDRGKVVIA